MVAEKQLGGGGQVSKYLQDNNSKFSPSLAWFPASGTIKKETGNYV